MVTKHELTGGEEIIIGETPFRFVMGEQNRGQFLPAVPVCASSVSAIRLADIARPLCEPQTRRSPCAPQPILDQRADSTYSSSSQFVSWDQVAPSPCW